MGEKAWRPALNPVFDKEVARSPKSHGLVRQLEKLLLFNGSSRLESKCKFTIIFLAAFLSRDFFNEETER